MKDGRCGSFGGGSRSGFLNRISNGSGCGIRETNPLGYQHQQPSSTTTFQQYQQNNSQMLVHHNNAHNQLLPHNNHHQQQHLLHNHHHHNLRSPPSPLHHLHHYSARGSSSSSSSSSINSSGRASATVTTTTTTTNTPPLGFDLVGNSGLGASLLCVTSSGHNELALCGPPAQDVALMNNGGCPAWCSHRGGPMRGGEGCMDGLRRASNRLADFLRGLFNS